MSTIECSQDYRLHVTVTPVARPAGHYHLKIQSQWLGAKDPDGLQTRYAVTLPKFQLQAIAATIIAGCKP